MSDYAVTLQKVSKMYRLFSSNRERIQEALHPLRRKYHREFWALRDIDLEIRAGASVGILGLNGSGKSTLLQIVSSVLRPTTGHVSVNGKVAALLELGAGLNPELSGRENVVMTSGIMGYDRDRTMRRMEEIERFADIGEFFDQPMRTYSSGMFMRVAFAASIFVDPDILIVDEALAVGDGKFAEKCYSRIRAFREQGKTILLVTHDRSTVPRICDTGVLLHRGRLVQTGPAKLIVDAYSEILAFGDIAERRAPAEVDQVAGATPSLAARPSTALPGHPPTIDMIVDTLDRMDIAENPLYNKYEYRFGNKQATIEAFCVVQDGSMNAAPIASDRPMSLYVKVVFHDEIHQPLVGFTVTSAQGVTLYGVHSGLLGVKTSSAGRGEARYFHFVLRPNLCSGDWFVELAVAASNTEMCDVRSKVVHLNVSSRQSFDGLAALDATLAEIPVPARVSSTDTSSA